ncbi:hypothetical protein [Escherichia albertii]|uniref:hypothetical protein n=1 Tax=Escherichia albertii TaxID=208962 RepID=UPI001A0A72DD|nr:hypothetical protein [Escherichia coli]EIE4189209.1 hypothetical protein [Escherichia coli]EIH7306796.1 hypothetical protein [Escherichia coli]EIJ4846587.1 hypothetical protein [Escherichia coli]EJC5470944.1 hypothetical protein [Escherichia coli]
MYPRKVRLRRMGRRAAAGRQRELRHQAQWPYTPSGVQGAPHPARPEKTDGTAMACGGHWYTTPAQVKTEKTARHLQSKKSEISSLFHTYFSR